jgi:hypothetical protein
MFGRVKDLNVLYMRDSSVRKWNDNSLSGKKSMKFDVLG